LRHRLRGLSPQENPLLRHPLPGYAMRPGLLSIRQPLGCARQDSRLSILRLRGYAMPPRYAMRPECYATRLHCAKRPECYALLRRYVPLERCERPRRVRRL
jgi:hypothetical protein